MPRTGRRAGEPDTRSRILDAARAAFAKQGYRATIRQIAADASVDPALVLHYFGAKESLYLASIEMPIDARAFRLAIRNGPHNEVGRRLAGFFFSVWEQPEARQPILAILRGAISGHDAGLDAFRGFLGSNLLPTVASEIFDEEDTLRVELAVAQLVGIAVMRYVVELEPIASTPLDHLIELIAPRIQTYFEIAV
jgi:AcrR family transcriptional regulator